MSRVGSALGRLLPVLALVVIAWRAYGLLGIAVLVAVLVVAGGILTYAAAQPEAKDA